MKIKTMTTQLETGQEEYDIKLSSIEEKVATVQTDRILTELQEVRNELALNME